MRTFALFVFTILITGCLPVAFGPGAADFSTPLANGYFVHRSSAHQIMVAPRGWGASTPIIPTKVVELDHDSKWIIAKQQHLQRRSPNNPNDTYEQPVPGVFSYWILNTQTPQVWGPLTLDGFIAERKRLAVNSKLHLHDVYDYRR